MLSPHYLGLYRTSITTVGQINSVVTSATTPILYSSLSRLQNDPEEFKNMFFKFQKLVGMLVIPLGMIIYLFRDFITAILLGPQWGEAAYFIGLWGLTGALTIVFSHYSSEVFRALGKPKLSVLVQVLHILFLAPIVWHYVTDDYDTLCFARAMVRLIMVSVVVLYYCTNISLWQMLKNVFPSIFVTLLSSIVMFLLPVANTHVLNVLYVIIFIIIYIFGVSFFSEERELLIAACGKIKRG
jgi:PST family polysaccharide transporter